MHMLKKHALTQKFSAFQIFDPPIQLSKSPMSLFFLIQAYNCIYMCSVMVLDFVLVLCSPY